MNALQNLINRISKPSAKTIRVKCPNCDHSFTVNPERDKTANHGKLTQKPELAPETMTLLTKELEMIVKPSI